ncbi:hypothetical protein N7456_005567 [Penicillium angulare]|uniref:Uncharacterized protein n=1 Tax=Penicillium angulare TaxID=116970 RepID=A0A9W9G0A6_9EURO|nr:hypothetical protein N7456_005567 [Penicillium angulare]
MTAAKTAFICIFVIGLTIVCIYRGIQFLAWREQKRRGTDQQSDIQPETELETELKQVEGDIPEPPYEIPNRDSVPVITSKTRPGHALSDMDRDIKLNTKHFKVLKKPEVEIQGFVLGKRDCFGLWSAARV